MTSDDHPEPEQRGDHPEPEQRGVQADTESRGVQADPEPRGLQAAWSRVHESAEHFRQAAGGLPERLPAVAKPSMPDLAWRDWFLFGGTGASILIALITAAIVVSDIVARGTQ
jgi:hypothetical protein